MQLKGFGVKVTPNGVVSFILNYYIFGRERRFTIGRWPQWTTDEARRKARDLRRQIDDDKDPLEGRREERMALTLNDLIDSYLSDTETLKLRPNTLRSYRGIAETILRPALGRHPLKAITQSDIAQIHAKMKDRPYQGNRMLSLLSAMYSYAMHEDRGWADRNPSLRRRKGKTGGIEHHPEVKRKRYLRPAEVERFHKALDAYVAEHQGTRYAQQAQDAVNALCLLLLTGSRLNEVLKATWEEFDLERGSWVKPSHHTKQKTEEDVPLSGQARELLEGMNPGRGPLFPGRNGKAARVSLRRPWVYACKTAGLHGVRLHDIRHSFASAAISNGVPLAVVGRLLGHTQASTTQRYAHLQDACLREATNQVGKVLSFDLRKRA